MLYQKKIYKRGLLNFRSPGDNFRCPFRGAKPIYPQVRIFEKIIHPQLKPQFRIFSGKSPLHEFFRKIDKKNYLLIVLQQCHLKEGKRRKLFKCNVLALTDAMGASPGFKLLSIPYDASMSTRFNMSIAITFQPYTYKVQQY